MMYRVSVYFTEDSAALAAVLAEGQDLPGLYGIFTSPAISRYVLRSIAQSSSPMVTKIEFYVQHPDGARDLLLRSSLTFATRVLIEEINDIF